MIKGVVRAKEACVALRVHGPRGKTQQIDAVLDTGYTAELTLPPHAVAKLRLKWKGYNKAILADGSTCLFDSYEALAIWDGREVRIVIDELDAQPLVGMGLLTGFTVNMEVQEGGAVSIKKLKQA